MKLAATSPMLEADLSTLRLPQRAFFLHTEDAAKFSALKWGLGHEAVESLRKVTIRQHSAVVVQRLTNGAATLVGASPVVRVDFETATGRMPIHQFGSN